MDLLPDQVFERLAEQEARLVIAPVPDAPLGSDLTAEDHAKELGWSATYELPRVQDERGSAPEGLPTVHFADDLNAIARHIGSTARTAIQETGANMLYLAIGFLHWYETDQDEQARQAPLLMVPVTIQRDRLGRRGERISLEYTGEDVADNLSLREKLRVDFGLSLPVIEEDERPERYLARVGEAIIDMARWKVLRYATLTFLSFTKHRMWLDLDPNNAAVATHSVVRELFEGTERQEVVAEEYGIDSSEFPSGLLTLVHDADSSQHSALIDAVRGRNLVIEGPPGTGKSQTITNLIAATLAAGKTVLFVSEKLAALQVVKDRLDRAGLGDFCLELHSHKTKRQELVGALEKRIHARGRHPDTLELERRSAAANSKKRTLIEYVNTINQPFGAANKTVWEISWGSDNNRRQLPEETLEHVDRIVLHGVEGWSREIYDEGDHLVRDFTQHAQAVLHGAPSIRVHAWYGTWNQELTYLDEPDLIQTLHDTKRLCDALMQAVLDLRRLCEWHLGVTLTAAKGAADARVRLPASQGPEWFDVFPQLADPAIRQLLKSFSQRVRDYWKERPQLERIITRLEGATRFFHENALRLLSRQAPFTLGTATYLQRCLECLEPARWDDCGLRHPCLEDDQVRKAFRQAAGDSDNLVREREDLGKDFDLSTLPRPVDLRFHATRLREAGLWDRLFGAKYRAAKRIFRGLSLRKPRLDRFKMAADLQHLARYEESLEAFHET